MKHSTLIGHSGDPAVDGGVGHSAGCLWPGNNVQAMSRSTRTQAQERSPQLAQTKMPRQAHDGERPEQAPNAATPTSDGHDPIHDRDTGPRIAKARQHPQKHTRTCNKLRPVNWLTEKGESDGTG